METWLLVQDCRSPNFVTNDKTMIREAVQHNVAKVCPSCSGARFGHEAFQVFHPSGPWTAEELVEKLDS